ncbi:MAG: phospholipase D-like domain-containing protein, partial [Candidatus Binatia bacterium]
FRPLVGRYLEALATLNIDRIVASEHDKVMVSDGERSLIGGRNIGAEYFTDPRDSRDTFHDTDLLLGGHSAARALTAAFEDQHESFDAWRAGGETVNLQSPEQELEIAYRAMDQTLRVGRLDATLAKKLRDTLPGFEEDLRERPRLAGSLRRRDERTLSAETRIVDSQTRERSSDDPITQAIVRLVRSSSRRIVLQSPYLVLSEEAVELLADAARRGVKITILTNSPVSSDNALSQAFFLEQWPEILARVPTMRLFVGGTKHTLHSKAGVFDGRVSMVGTYNLDPTSMMVNSEVMALVWSERFADGVERVTRRMIERGPPHAYEYRIRRGPSGEAVRDEDGKPIVAFGPKDHADPERWTSLNVFWKGLRAAEWVGVSPFF